MRKKAEANDEEADFNDYGRDFDDFVGYDETEEDRVHRKAEKLARKLEDEEMGYSREQRHLEKK